MIYSVRSLECLQVLMDTIEICKTDDRKTSDLNLSTKIWFRNWY